MLRRRCHLLGASRLATYSCLLALVWSSQAEYLECAAKNRKTEWRDTELAEFRDEESC